MIVIDVTARINKVEGPLKKVVDLVDKLERNLNKAAKAMEKLAIASAKVQAPSFAGGSPGTSLARAGSSGAPPKGASPMDVYRFLNGVNSASGGQFQGQRNQALLKAFQHYQSLAMGGDPSAMRAVSSLGPSVAKMMQPKKGFGQFAMSAIMSTRVGVGAGGVQVMPLVGQTIRALSALSPAVTAVLGPLALMAAGAMAVVGAMNSIFEFSNRVAANGTTPGTQGVLDRMRFLGGNAQSFGQNISSGTGAAFASQAGINPYSGVYGDFDVGAKFAKYAQFVGGSKSYRQAQQRAIAVGSPGLANMYYLSDENKKDLFDRSRGSSPKDIATSVNGAYAMNKMSDAFEKFVNKLAIKFAPAMIRIMTAIGNMLDWLGKVYDKLPQKFKDVINALGSSPLGNAGGVGKTNDKLADANERHIRALEDNTRALNAGRETTGGGARAQSVFPGRITGNRIGDPAYRRGLEGGIA